MIYFVTNNLEVFESEEYSLISTETSLSILNSCDILQFDSETNGRDAHINELLCIQFGNKQKDFQMVIDCTTVDVLLYKNILENKFIVGQNLKFDLQFLYNYGIIPLRVYDTMIVEQLLYLGYPYGFVGLNENQIMEYSQLLEKAKDEFPNWDTLKSDLKKSYFYSKNKELADAIYIYSGVSLKALCHRYLGIEMDKTVRGQIIWRGLDLEVILYAAKDVECLEDIMKKQLEQCRLKECIKAAQIECCFVPVISYLEWCGIKLDIDKWKTKMNKDQDALDLSIKELNKFVVSDPKLKEFTYVEQQGSLFDGWDLTPKCIINWASSQQVAKVAKALGFDVTVVDAKTGEDKESVMEKYLKSQKGINDEFLRLYLGKGKEGENDYFPGYTGSAKVVSSFGQGHLNAVNPKTGRIHTIYKQLGAASGRMSCGSKQYNTDLAKLKGLSPKEISYPNLQQLPADDDTRGSFVSDKDNMFVSCDFSALESRLGADIYNEPTMINEYLHGSGDIHSLVAKACFPKELEGIEVKDIKKRRPDLRKDAKAPEFACQFGGGWNAIMQSLGCSKERAMEIENNYYSMFSGIADFKSKGSKAVRKNGYVLMCKYTGHKMYWWDHKVWLKVQDSFTPEFWENYRNFHKGTNSPIALKVKEHFKAASKWDRMALNSVTQGTGIIILKTAMTNFFKWIIDNGYFGKVRIIALVHDEACVEYPKELTELPKILEKFMEEGAATYCKSVPIPACAEVGNYWIH